MAWWRTKHRNFDYKVTLTREQAEGYLAGRIDVVLPQLFPDLSKHTIFAAGSPEFVDTCVATVRETGREGRADPHRGLLRPAAAGRRRRRPPAAGVTGDPALFSGGPSG